MSVLQTMEAAAKSVATHWDPSSVAVTPDITNTHGGIKNTALVSFFIHPFGMLFNNNLPNYRY